MDVGGAASETIYLTLKKMNVQGAIVIKDSDNMVEVNFEKQIKNSIVGYNLNEHHDVTNILGKSFIIANKQGIICNIVEKQIVSNIICLGVYCFENAYDFIMAYDEVYTEKIFGEMYISRIISHILSFKNYTFLLTFALSYDDYGTLCEWEEIQKKYRAYFVDVDGVLMKNCGKYGKCNWYNNTEILFDNMEVIRKLQNDGAQIIITTSRPEEFRTILEKILNENGIKPYAMLMGMNHAARVIINDFAPTNPYPSGIAITLPRNGNLKDYF